MLRGVHQSPEKVQAIVEAPSPATVTEPRSFLGMLQYYGKFLPNLSTLLHPLNNLLWEGVSWSWQPECQEAFESAKELLQSAKVLLTFLLNWLVMPLHMVSERCYHMSCQVGKSALWPSPQEHFPLVRKTMRS